MPSDRDLLRRDLTDAEGALAVAGFGALWRGEAVHPAALLPDRTDAVEVAEALAARGRAQLDDDGRLVGIHGLTLHPGRHRVVAAGRDHYTWCAFDTVGIAAALAVDAVAHTDCGACHRPLTVVVAGGVPEAGDAVLWIPAGSVCNLMSDFCASADLYCDRAHLDAVVDPGRAHGTVTDLTDAAALGRDLWAEVAGVGRDPA